jgi:hypothetical protein
MIDGFGGFAAIQAPASRVLMQRLTPSAGTELRAEILKEHSIPGLHASQSVGRSLA